MSGAALNFIELMTNDLMWNMGAIPLNHFASFTGQREHVQNYWWASNHFTVGLQLL